jgi:hypothetical protein
VRLLAGSFKPEQRISQVGRNAIDKPPRRQLAQDAIIFTEYIERHPGLNGDSAHWRP